MPVLGVDSRVGRAVQRAATSRVFAPVASRVAPRLDRVVSRLSGGRFTVSALLVPTLVLHARGAKTGAPRVTPLACLPEVGGSFLVVGSNYGRTSHPAWTHNLLAHPDVQVVFGGRTRDLHATLLDAAEKDAVWDRLLAVWPTYADYTAMSGRDLRVFRLSP